MTRPFHLMRYAVFILCLLIVLPDGLRRTHAADAPRAVLIGTFILPKASLNEWGEGAFSPADLEQAHRNGLQFTNLPSIGSGLARASDGGFWGITDRGPNGKSGNGKSEHRIAPLPKFCPGIVHFQLSNGVIEITRFIPLHDSHGRCISGLSNLSGDEPLYESPEARAPLPYDQNGVDPEAIRVLPNGDFLLSEEYSPSVLVVSTNGEVLMRYTPNSKPLPKADYPVKAILPEVFAQRRINKGFENLALSPNGQTAYVLLQSPMGDTDKKKWQQSRIIRALKLDVSDPLNLKVIGEYLAPASAADEYPGDQKQSSLDWSDADWLAPDQLLVVERGKHLARFLCVDFSRATDILRHPEENRLKLEERHTDLADFSIRTARVEELFSTRDLPGIKSRKIEGLAILSPTEIALSNDNDFGYGDNPDGEPSMAWLIQLSKALPLATRP